MEDIRQKREAPSKSQGSRQAGFTISDRTNHNPETEVSEVAFINHALKEAITQGASYIHIEPSTWTMVSPCDIGSMVNIGRPRGRLVTFRK